MIEPYALMRQSSWSIIIIIMFIELYNGGLKNINISDFKSINFQEITVLQYITIVLSLFFVTLVRIDALKAGLLQEKQDIKKNIKRRIITNIILYLFVVIGFSIMPNFLIMLSNSSIMILGFILLMVFFALLVFMPYSTIVYISHYKILNTVDPYVRNKEGKTINLKLEGLRKCLIDFSKIEEKTKEQLILWEEYLIYSVILGINTKMIDEVYNKIK